MGKVLIATFRDDEEIEELILFLKQKSNIEILDNISTDKVLIYEGLEIDPIYRVVRTNGMEIEMTNYEFGILYLLARNPGQVFSRGQIYTQVWSSPYYGADDSVSSLIRRIRKKIEPDPARPIYILTVWGVGYKFNNALEKK
jgi:DNA-binding response OmpR family regulator